MLQTHEVRHPFINGQFDFSNDTETFTAVNPAVEEPLGDVVQCDAGHVEHAVQAAAAAQSVWSAMAPGARGESLWAWSELIAQETQALAELDTANMGKPIGDSVALVNGAAHNCHYWAGMTDKIWGRMLPVTPGHLSYTQREPLGVVGVILPWNVPASGFVGRVAPSLACGNAVVVKPSEFSPLSALRLAELAIAAGIPDGLINVITGDGRVGAMLSSHPGVHGISFTGSIATGRKVNEAAASTFKRVVLELGGKSPNIVFSDANLDEALRGTIWGVFFNSGQICSAGTRLLIDETIAAAFVDRLREMAVRIRIGDPTDSATQIGPLACQQQYDRVQRYLEIGREEATLELGGGRPRDLPGDRGYYVEPTIFTDAAPSSRIAQEEIFGPVLTVLTFKDEEEAVRIANDVDYGLGATIWTNDSARLIRTAHAIEAGNVWANTPRVLHPALPYAGFKNSGLGSATGDGAIEGNTRVRRVTIRFDGPVRGWDL